MILAIISSNDILIKNMAYYIPKNITQVVCGNESLIDKEVISYSKKYGIPYKVFELQKNIQPEIANRVRNEVVSEYADNFILFWDGKDENILKLYYLYNFFNIFTSVTFNIDDSLHHLLLTAVFSLPLKTTNLS